LGLVKEAQLAATLRRALQVGLPLGRALVMSGHLTEDELGLALEMQALIRTEEVSLAQGTQAFVLATADSISLGEALKRLGVFKATEARLLDAKLGRLLLDANRLNPAQLEEAQARSIASGSPLGRTLILSGLLTQAVLEKAQEYQNMIREGMIPYSEAIKLMKGTRERKPILETRNGQELPKVTTAGKKFRLTDLLVLSKVISEEDMADAIELSLSMPESLGNILIDTGHLSQETLAQAFELQQSITNGDLDPIAAAEALRYIASANGKTPAEQNKGPYPPQDNIRLGELLRKCGFVNSKDIDEALSLSHKCSSLIGEMLVLTGVIGQETLLSALRCQSLLRRGLIHLDQGVNALRYSMEKNVSFESALESLGISVTIGV